MASETLSHAQVISHSFFADTATACCLLLYLYTRAQTQGTYLRRIRDKRFFFTRDKTLQGACNSYSIHSQRGFHGNPSGSVTDVCWQVKDIFDHATLQKCSVCSYTCTEGTYFLRVEDTLLPHNVSTSV